MEARRAKYPIGIQDFEKLISPRSNQFEGIRTTVECGPAQTLQDWSRLLHPNAHTQKLDN